MDFSEEGLEALAAKLDKARKKGVRVREVEQRVRDYEKALRMAERTKALQVKNELAKARLEAQRLRDEQRALKAAAASRPAVRLPTTTTAKPAPDDSDDEVIVSSQPACAARPVLDKNSWHAAKKLGHFEEYETAIQSIASSELWGVPLTAKKRGATGPPVKGGQLYTRRWEDVDGNQLQLRAVCAAEDYFAVRYIPVDGITAPVVSGPIVLLSEHQVHRQPARGAQQEQRRAPAAAQVVAEDDSEVEAAPQPQEKPAALKSGRSRPQTGRKRAGPALPTQPTTKARQLAKDTQLLEAELTPVEPATADLSTAKTSTVEAPTEAGTAKAAAVASEPATAVEPATTEPAAAEPATAAAPDTAERSTAERATAEPATAEPATYEAARAQSSEPDNSGEEERLRKRRMSTNGPGSEVRALVNCSVLPMLG